LKLILRIYQYDESTNCIIIERVLGSIADFIEEYNNLRNYVFDEL